MFNRFLLELTDPLSFIQIREDVKSGVYVENLTEEQVSTMKDVTQLLLKV
jgi:kinesin family protein 15